MSMRTASPLTATAINQQIAAATATIPVTTTGGIYNQASLGTGLSVVIFVSGGVVSSILSVVTGGTGYAVGDVLVLPSGNADAVVRITNVSGGVVQSGGVSVVYGGTGYTTGVTVPAVPIPAGQRTIEFSGVLTSNVTLILQNGTLLNASRKAIVANNTTGAFTSTVFISNGAGGTTGNGLVIPQGTNNNAAVLLFTDGVTDVWSAETSGATVCTTAADNAVAGRIGEYITANASGVAMTTATPVNVTSISLTAGDWDVIGSISIAGNLNLTIAGAGISTVSATLGAATTQCQLQGPAFTAYTGPTPNVRLSLAATTTVYLVASATFASSTASATGLIRARRVR